MIAETPLRVLILAMDIARNTAAEGHECGPGHNRYQKAVLRCERMQFPKRDARFHRYKAGVFFKRQNSIQTPRQNKLVRFDTSPGPRSSDRRRMQSSQCLLPAVEALRLQQINVLGEVRSSPHSDFGPRT